MTFVRELKVGDYVYYKESERIFKIEIIEIGETYFGHKYYEVKANDSGLVLFYHHDIGTCIFPTKEEAEKGELNDLNIKVYFPKKDFVVYSATLGKPIYTVDSKIMCLYKEKNLSNAGCYIEDIGKVVFLTEEEAKAKAQEEKEKSDRNKNLILVDKRKLQEFFAKVIQLEMKVGDKTDWMGEYAEYFGILNIFKRG